MRKSWLVFLLCLFSVSFQFFNGCLSRSGTGSNTAVKDSEALPAKTAAPVIGKLSLSAYGPDFITLHHQPMLPEAEPLTTIQAYLGLNGKLSAAQDGIKEALRGPVDLSSGTCTFRGLKPDESYGVIVLATNRNGAAIKHINAVRPDINEIQPSDYPEMSDAEIGQLKWTMRIANDKLDDFSRIPTGNLVGIPGTGALQIGGASRRYAIAFHTYFLASEQFHKIPACKELLQAPMDRLIQKMIQKKVWDYWALTSTSVYTAALGKLSEPFYKSERDPIRVRNIMYSGHLANMIALYEKLYGDMKWSKPGSIVFAWSDKEKYVYDNQSLHKLLRDSFLNLKDHCIECEPKSCYPECNQHPILALKVYDDIHGTHYYDDVKGPLMDWFLSKNMIDPVTHASSLMYLTVTGKTLGPDTFDLGNGLAVVATPVLKTLDLNIESVTADGWTFAFMNAWQPEYIKAHYPYNKQRHFDKNGRLKLNDDVTMRENLRKGILGDQIAAPFYALLTAEMGDRPAKAQVLKQCDAIYKPRWNADGSLEYPLGKIESFVSITEACKASSLTAALIGLARSNVEDGLLKLHGEPLPGAGGPVVRNVDFNRLHLKRAMYDAKREALVITADQGTYALPGQTWPLILDNLDQEKTWHLKMDGVQKTVVTGMRSLVVDVPLDGRHDIILAAE